MAVKLKRVYEPPQRDDGYRILVDRLWPRGIAKEKAGFDLWLKEIAPSDALRKWFGHDPTRWARFRERYFRELDKSIEAVAELRRHVRKGTVTLLYAAKDEQFNNARALKEYLAARRPKRKAGVAVGARS